MIFEPPTDEQKRQWAKSQTIERAEFGGNVYELAETGVIYALDRIGEKPSQKKKVGYLALCGVIENPTPKLLENIKQSSDADGWRN